MRPAVVLTVLQADELCGGVTDGCVGCGSVTGG